MPDRPVNGTVARGVSTFEDDFREFNGRSPTAEEIRRHLAFDRLAKSSSLDPLTMLLIVDAGRSDRDEMAAQFARIEQRIDDLARRPAVIAGRRESSEFGSALRDFFVFAGGVAVCELIFAAVGFGRLAPPLFDRVGMFVLGLSAAGVVLLWQWMVPQVRAMRR